MGPQLAKYRNHHNVPLFRAIICTNEWTVEVVCAMMMSVILRFNSSPHHRPSITHINTRLLIAIIIKITLVPRSLGVPFPWRCGHWCTCLVLIYLSWTADVPTAHTSCPVALNEVDGWWLGYCYWLTETTIIMHCARVLLPPPPSPPSSFAVNRLIAMPFIHSIIALL